VVTLGTWGPEFYRGNHEQLDPEEGGKELPPNIHDFKFSPCFMASKNWKEKKYGG